MVPTPTRPPVMGSRELRAALHVSRERMARMFDISAKTVERWETQNTPPTADAAAEIFARLQQIAQLGQIVYTQGFTQFMTTPLHAFQGRTAVKLLERGESEQVLAALAADYEGLGS